MKITYPSNGKGLIEKWDLNDLGQKILFDKREKYKNLVYDDVPLGKAKKENVRNVLIIQRDGYQKALDELWAGGNSLIGDKNVFNSMFFERQIEFYNGLIEKLDNLDLFYLEARNDNDAVEGNASNKQDEPEPIEELISASKIKREKTKNGKHDIEGKRFDLLIYCAGEGYFDTLRLDTAIIDKYINHGYKNTKSLQSSIDRVKRESKKEDEIDQARLHITQKISEIRQGNK